MRVHNHYCNYHKRVNVENLFKGHEEQLWELMGVSLLPRNQGLETEEFYFVSV